MRTTWLDSLGAIALMGGAIYSHLSLLGIEIYEDGGTLFILAVVVLIIGIINLITQKQYFMLFVKALKVKKV